MTGPEAAQPCGSLYPGGHGETRECVLSSGHSGAHVYRETPIHEAAAERARQARAVAHRAVTEGVNVKYVEVMRRELYSLSDDYDALAAELSAAQERLRWYEDHKTADGSYDGGLFGDLAALAPDDTEPS